MADTLIFLDIPGIKGEATAQGFIDKVELESLTWDMTAEHKHKVSGTSQTQKDPKITVDLRPGRVTVTKHYDRTSINLAQHMMMQKVFDEAKITYTQLLIRPEGQKSVPILELFLFDGRIEDVNINASESGKAITVKETVQLSFRNLELVYYPRDVRHDARGRPHTFETNQPTAAK